MTDFLSEEFSRIQTKFESFSKEGLIQRVSLLEGELARLVKENYKLRNQNISATQLELLLEEQISFLNHKIFGSQSEKLKNQESSEVSDQQNVSQKKEAQTRLKKPSQRYPNLPIVEKIISMDPLPLCNCCGAQMADSGMTEDSEQLTVIPKKYEIHQIKRKKYRCECHSSLITAPVEPRIKEGSSYSDEMIQDVTLTKYCDLVPMERYAAMAKRGSKIDLPPHSLIELTHYFSHFVGDVYLSLKKEVLNSRVISADETPHKMLEGCLKKNWYLWGFSTKTACYFECHDTRSGDVASDILFNSKCEVLLTDIYSGYGKAVRLANEVREKNKKQFIKNANCNAHARRYFFQSLVFNKEASFYLESYQEIYKLNSESSCKTSDEILFLRNKMRFYFKKMKDQVFIDLSKCSEKSKFAKSLKYFYENYEGLTLFLLDPDVPIDNNSQERLFRSHVVGRKTWYGTHSKLGAKTSAVMFSIVESCKLVGVNPRDYFSKLVKDLLAGKKSFTPFDFKKLNEV